MEGLFGPRIVKDITLFRGKNTKLKHFSVKPADFSASQQKQVNKTIHEKEHLFVFSQYCRTGVCFYFKWTFTVMLQINIQAFDLSVGLFGGLDRHPPPPKAVIAMPTGRAAAETAQHRGFNLCGYLSARRPAAGGTRRARWPP